MEDLLQFDIQRFADGDTTDGTTSTEDSTVETTTPPAETGETTSDTQEDSFDFSLDENGNLMFTEEEDSPVEQPTETEKPVEQKPVMVKVKINGVEEEVTIDEAINGYQRQSDYTRSKQELARERAELEQLRQQVKTPIAPPVKPKDIITQMSQDAMAIAHKTLELDKEDPLNEYDPVHIAAYNNALFMLQQQEFQAQQRQSQYAELLSTYKGKEPENYDAIDAYAHHRLTKELPRAESDIILEAIQLGKFEVVKSFIEDTRQKWYEKNLPAKAPVTKAPVKSPPKVEPAGIGITPNSAVKTRDINAIRGKSMDDTVAQLVKWGLA